MNVPVFREGGSPVVAAVIGGVVAGIFGIILLFYGSQINAQSSAMKSLNDDDREYGRDISQLKVTSQTQESEEQRTASSIVAMESRLTEILGSLQGLKDKTDEATRQLDGLQKSFADVDLILRPARAPNSNGH